MPDGQASSARAASCRSGPAAFAFLAPFLAIVLARGRGPVLVPHCPKFAQARSLSTTIHFSIAAANSLAALSVRHAMPTRTSRKTGQDGIIRPF
jgi:hypothetical protein